MPSPEEAAEAIRVAFNNQNESSRHLSPKIHRDSLVFNQIAKTIEDQASKTLNRKKISDLTVSEIETVLRSLESFDLSLGVTLTNEIIDQTLLSLVPNQDTLSSNSHGQT